jgi:outer membrane receptor for ferrienterochelin and colicin
MKFKSYIILILILAVTSDSFSGNTGSISGKLIDKNTRQELPGAIITIVDTKLWTVADKYGFYFISNISPGTYEIRVNMLGYATIIMKDVGIRADYMHEINFEMVSEAIEGPEIIIIAEKPLITKDSPSTCQALNSSSVNRKLPIDHFYQALKTQSSVIDGHIRGGRKYDALFMIDGHSVQDPMFREISTLVPLSAISDINILSGGFNAEYGQAMSGVVNLSTKEGKEKTEGFFKIYTDNFGLKVKNDNLRRMEMSLGGPLLLSFGGPMYDLNYYISGTTNFDNMQFSNNKNQGKQVAPIDHNYHYTSKLSFRLWQKIKIVFQSLSSSWQLNNPNSLSSVPKDEKISINKKKYGNRLNLTVIHTLNPKSFYTFSCGRDIFKKQFYNQITMSKESTLDLDVRYQTAKSTYNWSDLISERDYFFKSSYYRQFASSDIIHLGTQLNFYRIYMNNLAFDQLSDSNEFDDDFSQENYADKLYVKPYTIALFAQNRIEYGHVVINFGIRFDYFNPNVNFPEQSVISSRDTLKLSSKRGKSQFQISPRCELSFPFLFKNDRLYLNYGWFFQTPPLYYFYLNSRQNFDLNYPLLGNPQLAPEKTKAFQIEYQKAIGSKSIVGTIFFVKNVENLVNTKYYYSGHDLQINYTQFENLDHAMIKGLEFFVEKRPGNNNFHGKLSYTYCKATGTGSFPLQNFYSYIKNPFSYRWLIQYPLAWDQRHTVCLNISYLNPKKIEINLLTRISSPLPLLDDSFRAIDRGKWRKYIDLKIIKSLNLFKGDFSPYVEILNILNDQEQDRVYNPYYLTDDHYWMLGLDNYQYEYGRRFRLGLIINF